MSCHLNCSERPVSWSPDNDITGPGVVTNYIASAGIAVFAVLIYYFSIYEPTQDPFGKKERALEDPPFHANAIDQIVIHNVRSWFPKAKSRRFKSQFESYISKVVSGHSSAKDFLDLKLTAKSHQFIVALGDFQLITGFSILIGGSIQLDCGLTVYEWQVIVNLAWFSSLTHLSCLMVLRSYLYAHTFGRTWRLISMGILATLLSVGLLPTANYVDLLHSRSPDYAKCFLAIHPASDLALWSMILSVLIIVLGFLSRVVKLHKALSLTVLGNLRVRVSARSRNMLHAVYNWCVSSGPMQEFRIALIYRPLFALFLVIRFSLDAWSSMFVEILWLFIAFVWGILRLMFALNDVPPLENVPKEKEVWTLPTSHKREDWTFGQIVSLVLLAAPLINLLEYSDENTQNHQPNSTPRGEDIERSDPSYRSIQSFGRSQLEQIAEFKNSDSKWYNQSKTLGIMTIYSLTSMVNIIMELFLFSMSGDLISTIIDWDWAIKIFLAFTGVYGLTLFSLLIQSKMTGGRKWTRRFLFTLNIFFHMLSFNLAGRFPPDGSYPILNYMQLFALGLYAFSAILLCWVHTENRILSSS